MIRSWSAIVERYVDLTASVGGGEEYSRALEALEHLAEHIRTTDLAKVLFGWTSMHDLCVVPAKVQWSPHLIPHLRIAPLRSGLLSFRYADTMIDAREWRREADAAGAIPRLHAFVDQLGWARGLAWAGLAEKRA